MILGSVIRRLKHRSDNRSDATSEAARARSERVAAIMDSVIRQCNAGEKIDDAEIETRHADLMPDLGQQLHTFRAIQAARDRARQLSGSDDSDSVDQLLQEEQCLLREALSGYELLEQIRYGGQGVVYKAVQYSTGRAVALKILIDGPLASARQRRRFEREVDLLSRIQHPNIVTLYDSGVVQGRPYFAMELIEGLPIDDYVLLEAPRAKDRLRVFTTVARAVSAAHQRGIIHRDLKPANILVDDEGQPHVLDFGFAKDLHIATGSEGVPIISLPGQVVGTPPYLSPEQVQGLDDEVDVRTDIYSLGVILFRLLTGEFPYPVGGSVRTLRDNIVSREPMPLRQAISSDQLHISVEPQEIDGDLQAIVLKALEKEKSRRYQSAVAFADDLDRYLAGEAVEARAERRFYLLKKTLRKYRMHVAVSAAFVVVLLAGLAGTTLMWQRAERVARTAQTGLEMGSFLKLGSVHRDGGRLNQARAMFEKAIEIGKHVPASDPFVQRHRYDAHHRLAELCLQTSGAGDAEAHCRAAVEIAEELLRYDPNDLEWQRILGFAKILEGRMAVSQEDWEEALDHFDTAGAIRKDLVLRAPDTASLRSELAQAHRWQGRCCRRLRRFQEALEHYTASYRIVTGLAEAHPGVIDYVIDLARSEIKLAVLSISRESPEHYQDASRWLQRARDRLIELSGSEGPSSRQWDVDKLLDAICSNEQIISKRTRTGATS
ncbi:MAG: serine/threonine-protein kinase [Planctomycetota bacterium]|jgi:tetratricopeptide (TPR) repeat protein